MQSQHPQPEPDRRTALEIDEELNARRNCSHPRSAVVVDEFAPEGPTEYCNCCEQYIK